jgi:pentatricopeptide repeat protein
MRRLGLTHFIISFVCRSLKSNPRVIKCTYTAQAVFPSLLARANLFSFSIWPSSASSRYQTPINYQLRLIMLKIYHIARPFSNLRRFVVIPLLGSRYRPLSSSSRPQTQNAKDKIDPYGLYQFNDNESKVINRLLLLVNSRSFENLISMLKSTPSTTRAVFERIIQHKYGCSLTTEIDVKEKIVEIMEKRGEFLRAGSIVPMIALYGRVGNMKKADALFQKMNDDGSERTVIVYNVIIKCHERDSAKVDSLFKELLEEGIRPDIITYNSMIRSYLRCGKLEKAEEVFDRMLEEGINPSLTIFTSMCKAYALRGDSRKSVEFFGRMLDNGVKPDQIALDTMKSAFAKDENRYKIEKLFNRMDGKSNYLMLKLLRAVELITSSTPHISITSSLENNSQYRLSDLEIEAMDHLIFLANSGKVDDLFTSLKCDPSMSILVFNKILQYKFGLSISRESAVKEKIVDIMVQRGIFPNASSFVPMIALYGRAGNIKKADEMLCRMKEYEIARTAAVYNSLMMCHIGDLSKIDSLFAEMIENGIRPDIFTYDSMIRAYNQHDNFDKAINLFDRMLVEGVKPTIYIYTMMIRIHGDRADIEMVEVIFSRMIELGTKPDLKSFSAVKRAFGMSGEGSKDVERAEEFFLRMKDEGDKPPVGFKDWFHWFKSTK